MDLQIRAASADVPDLVRVEAAGVSGWCLWPDAPEVGATVDVELDVPGEVPWDDIVGDGDGAGGPPGPEPAGLVVRGVVTEVDEHDVATLNLPSRGVLLVDTVGERPPHVVGQVVTVHLTQVVVHPTAA